MVDQKSDNFRTLTGNHGGLRRGTAAAALGAVLVLSAGVPASNAATPAWITDAVSTDSSSADSSGADSESTDSLNRVTLLPDTDDDDTGGESRTGARLTASVSGDAADLEAWAAAALTGEQDPPVYPAPTRSTASALSQPTESLVPLPEGPSLLSSTTPTPPVPLPSRPSPSTTAAPLEPSEPATTAPTTPAPSAEPSATPESGATPSTTQQSVPAPSPATSPAPGQVPAAGTPAPAPAGTGPTDAAPAPASETSGAGGSLENASGAQAAASRAYGRSASGVWGSGELSGPMNMASLGDRYAAGAPYSGAVLGASDEGSVSPLVWAGAVLVVLAGAAGLVAFRIRRSL